MCLLTCFSPLIYTKILPVLEEARLILWREHCISCYLNYTGVHNSFLIVVLHMLLPNTWMTHEKIIKATFKIYFYLSIYKDNNFNALCKLKWEFMITSQHGRIPVNQIIILESVNTSKWKEWSFILLFLNKQYHWIIQRQIRGSFSY